MKKVFLATVMIIMSLMMMTACTSPSDKTIKAISQPNGLLDQYIYYVNADGSISKQLKESRVTHAQSIIIMSKRID